MRIKVLLFMLFCFTSIAYSQTEIINIPKSGKETDKFTISINLGREQVLENLTSMEIDSKNCNTLETEHLKKSDEFVESYNDAYENKMYSNYIEFNVDYAIRKDFSVFLGLSLSQYHKNKTNEDDTSDIYKLYSSTVSPALKLGVTYKYKINDLISLQVSPSIKYGFKSNLKYDVIAESGSSIDDNNFKCDYSSFKWAVPVIATFNFKHITPFVGAFYSDFVNKYQINTYNDYLDDPIETLTVSKFNASNKISGLVGVGVNLTDCVSVSALGTFNKVINGQISLNISL